MFKLLPLLILIPLVELWLLIEVGRAIGSVPTILLVAATGFAGLLLAKSQGLSVLRRMQADLEQGILPGDIILDGVCILAGGTMLLAPGLLTDLLGLLLLVPVFRRYIIKTGQRYIRRKLDEGGIWFWRRW